jgi:hypothetical protein
MQLPRPLRLDDEQTVHRVDFVSFSPSDRRFFVAAPIR